jgi:hypothetical protein
MEFFTHSGCFSREGGLKLIEIVLKDFPSISFKEVDMVREEEKALSLGVRISPTLMLDGKIIAVGIPAEKKLRILLKENIYD